MRLDDIVKGTISSSDAITMVKIDTERVEEHVIYGMSRIMQENPNIQIIFEADTATHLEPVNKLLHRYGFQVIDLADNNYLAKKAIR